MTFAHPVALVLLLSVPWLWWSATPRLRRPGRGRLTWRCLTIVAFVFGAAGLEVAAGHSPLTIVVAIDRSASVPGAVQRQMSERIDALTATMQPRDRIGMVSFAADAIVDARPADVAAIARTMAEPLDTGTDIGAAIRTARTLLPSDAAGRIVLVSDGRETTGDAGREALAAGAAGVPVDVIVPDTSGVVEPPRVSAVIAPRTVAAGEPYQVVADVTGRAGARTDVAVYKDDQIVTTARIAIDATGSGIVTLDERDDRPGAAVYRASALAADGGDVSGGAAGAVVTVVGRSRVLYVSPSAGVLPDALARAGYALTRVHPADLSTLARGLSGYAAIVLDDVAAEEMSQTAAAAVREYVEQTGGGLLLLGNARTLTLDGFPAGPLGDALPIDLRPRTGSRAPSMALVVVFDKSGSMADASNGVPKIEIAREAVRRVADVMPAGDLLGVIAFDNRPSAVMPLAAIDGRTLATRLQGVAAGGATSIAPALELADDWFQQPRASAAARRQILLLSDGRSSPADAVRVRAIAARSRAAVSVVAIGPNPDRELLDAVARASGGRAYFPEDVRDLPRLVAREAARSAGGGVVEERFVPRAVPHPVIQGLAALPPLNGYVVAAAKPASTVILASRLDDPILCAWRAGLGRVVVYTADLGSAWSTPLRDWRDGARLWTQVVRWVGRPAPDGALRAAVKDTPRGVRVELDAEDAEGHPIDLDAVRATVRTPGGDQQPLVFSAIEPGRYAAPLPAVAAGAVAIALTAHDGGTGTERRLAQTLYWSADREHRRSGVDRPFLERLAAASGGRVLQAGESPFTLPRSRAYVDAAPWAIAIGLAMFVGDLAVARLPRRWANRQGSRAAGNRVVT